MSAPDAQVKRRSLPDGIGVLEYPASMQPGELGGAVRRLLARLFQSRRTPPQPELSFPIRLSNEVGCVDWHWVPCSNTTCPFYRRADQGIPCFDLNGTGKERDG